MNTAFAELEQVINQALNTPWAGLRRDLRLHHGAKDEWQQPTWTLEDPVSGKLFRLSGDEHDLLLCLLASRGLGDALARYQQRFHRQPEVQAILGFLQLLQAEGLAAPPLNPAQAIAAMEEPAKKGFGTSLRGLISQRFPLLRPDPFLTATLPYVRWLWSPWLRFLYIVLAIIGVIRVVPQWEQFVSSAGYLLTPQGVIAFTLTLVFSKILHEFSHAYAAKQQGLFVPSMGVVLIVLWPVLYTDITQAWKLTSRRQRFWIDAAGVLFEFTIAGLALLLWSFTGPGLLANLLFFLASTAVIGSLLINLNPLMRFDGYYMLMDLWGVDNLQPRGFAWFRYRLRRWLWDWQGPRPEPVPHPSRLAIYGLAAGLYRIVIGFSIAYLLYRFLQPQIGIIVFLLVFGLFALTPIWGEFQALAKERHYFGKRWRVGLSLMVFAGFMLLLFVPWQASSQFPAMILFADTQELKAPTPSKITSPLPKIGQLVSAGELLLTLEDEALEHELGQVSLELQKTKARIEGLATRGEQGGLRNWLQSEQQRLQARLDTLQANKALLNLVAPRDAVIVDVNDKLREGVYVSDQILLLTLADPQRREAQVYIPETDLAAITDVDLRLAELQVRHGVLHTIEVQLLSAKPQRLQGLPRASLYDIQGGPIASHEPNGLRQPKVPQFMLSYQLVEPPKGLRHGMPAKAWLGGERRSIAAKISNAVVRRLAADEVL